MNIKIGSVKSEIGDGTLAKNDVIISDILRLLLLFMVLLVVRLL